MKRPLLVIISFDILMISSISAYGQLSPEHQERVKDHFHQQQVSKVPASSVLEIRENDPELARKIKEGHAAISLRQNEEAVLLSKQILGLDPNNYEAHIMLGILYIRLERKSDSKREFELGAQFAKEALEKDLDDWKAHRELGIFYYSIDRKKDAISEYKEAIRIKPNDALTYFCLLYTSPSPRD